MKNTFFCLFFVIPFSLFAQYRVELFPNAVSGQNGSWNLSTWMLKVNGRNIEEKGFLTLEVLDEQHRSIYEARSGVFRFWGFQQPQSLASLSMEQQNSDPHTDQWIRMAGCLPEGRYLIRLQLFNIRNQLLAAKEIVWRPGQPCMMPLQLIAPAHLSKLSNTPSSFHWTTPFNERQFPALTYTLSLVEQFGHQSKEQAILNNPSLLQQEMPRGQLPYPPTSSALEAGHTYAWMVVASWKGREVGRSQVWSFLVTESAPKERPEKHVPNRVTYFKTGDPQNPPVYLLRESVLGFYYKNTRAKAQLQLVLSDGSGKTFANRPLDTQPGVRYGQLDLNTLGISEGEVKKKYRLDILDNNKRIETLFFQF